MRLGGCMPWCCLMDRGFWWCPLSTTFQVSGTGTQCLLQILCCLMPAATEACNPRGNFMGCCSANCRFFTVVPSHTVPDLQSKRVPRPQPL